LKISHHFAKLWARVWCPVIFDSCDTDSFNVCKLFNLNLSTYEQVTTLQSSNLSEPSSQHSTWDMKNNTYYIIYQNCTW